MALLHPGLRRRHQSRALQGSAPSAQRRAAGPHARAQRPDGRRGRSRPRADGELKIVNEIDRPSARQPIWSGASRPSRPSRPKLLRSLKPTDINFKTFLPLFLQHEVAPDFPSFYAQGYLHDQTVGRDDWTRLDAANRQSLDAYLENIHTMERLTRLNVNLALLQTHLAQNQAAGKPTIEAEISRPADRRFPPGDLPRRTQRGDRAEPQATRASRRSRSSPDTATATSTTCPRWSSAPTPAMPRRTATASSPPSGRSASRRRRWRS